MALKVSPEQMEAEARLAAAIKLHELRGLSSGVAAKLAGVPRAVFLAKLAHYGVATFRLTGEQLEREIQLASGY